MPWHIRITDKAETDLSRLPARDREAVLQALHRLVTDFGSADVKKLRGREDEWRLRAGRWRAILLLSKSTGVINVSRVLPRDKAYRD